jgi:glucosylceramidase
MSTFHAQRPSLDTIVDECSPGISAIPTPEVVIASLRNWATTVALWNYALSPQGGPVQEPNTGCPGCFGLAAINPQTGKVRLNMPFFQLGQASKFLEPGALRVASNTFVTYNYEKPGVNFISAGLDDVAFLNPDGTRVLLAYNNSTVPITFAVGWHGTYFQYSIPAGAMTTFKWDSPIGTQSQ